MTTYRKSFFIGSSKTATTPSALLSGHFDLCLLSVGWDRRCKAITDCTSLSASSCVVLDFEGDDALGYMEQHRKTVMDFAYARCQNVRVVRGLATDLDTLWNLLFETVIAVLSDLPSPASVLLDLSAYSRYYSLASVAALMRLGLASSLTVFYAEAEYTPTAGPPVEYVFSKGQWSAVPIPFLVNPSDPAKKKFFFVSVGFEGAKTARVLAKEDPDRVAVLFPFPGFRPEYGEKTKRYNQQILDAYAITDQQIVMAPAGDAVAAWRAIDTHSPKKRATENTFYLCCGTKPHSLGLALHALTTDYVTVLYNRPERHNFVDVRASGVYWLYQLRDTSSLVARNDITEERYAATS